MYSIEVGWDVIKVHGILYPACSRYLTCGFSISELRAPNLAPSILSGLSTNTDYFLFANEIKCPTSFCISITHFKKCFRKHHRGRRGDGGGVAAPLR